jgi:hypothetical protein
MHRSITTKIPALRAFCAAFLVDHILLHPDGWNLQLNRLIHNFFHELRPPENIHDVDLFRHVE